jgi:hypothetical protein
VSDAEAGLLAEKFRHDDLREVGGGGGRLGGSWAGGKRTRACEGEAPAAGCCLSVSPSLGARRRADGRPAPTRPPRAPAAPRPDPQLVNYVAFSHMVDPGCGAAAEEGTGGR